MPRASTDVYTKQNIWPLSPFNSLLSPFVSIIYLRKLNYIRISPSDYPSRILSVALSFVRPMPIRLPNFCPNSRNGQPLISHNRIVDRPTSDVSAARLSAIVFKLLILSIKRFALIHHSPFNLGRIMQSAPLINHPEMQYNS